MAKKKSKSKKRGAASTDQLVSSLGASGMKVVKDLQRKYDRDTLLCAYRLFPKLGKQTEDLLAQLPASEAKDIRSKLLKVL